MVARIARLLSLEFRRIPFTPDSMPSDITGTEVLDEPEGTGLRRMRFVKGPIFASIGRGSGRPSRCEAPVAAMIPDDLEDRIRTLVAQHAGVAPEEIRPETDVVDDLRIYGDDVWDLVEEYSEQFSVEMRDFRWYHHSGPEGCNPFWLFSPPWWTRKTHVPIRLSDLVESARRGVWVVQYPEHEREA